MMSEADSVKRAQGIAALVAIGWTQDDAAVAVDKAMKVAEVTAKAREKRELVLLHGPEIEAGLTTPFGTIRGKACHYLLETEKGSRTEEGFEYFLDRADGKREGPFYAKAEYILNRAKALNAEHERLFTGGRDSKTVARSQAE